MDQVPQNHVPKISVFIIARDEEQRIAYTIRSVIGWVDEVIVVEWGSIDRTVQVAKVLGAKVIHKEWEGFGPQKSFAESQCRNHVVLNLDADEAVSPALKRSIQAEQNKGFPRDCYWVRIKSMFTDQAEPPRFAHSVDRIRLYDKRKAGFSLSNVHDVVIPHDSGSAFPKLVGLVLHRTFLDLQHFAEKTQFYARAGAVDLIRRGKKPSGMRLVTEPILAFVKAYVMRRTWVFGVRGYAIAVISAYGRFIRQVIFREMYKDIESSGQQFERDLKQSNADTPVHKAMERQPAQTSNAVVT